MFGWAGKILHVDLTKYRISKEDLPENLAKKFLGGRGVNAKFLWDLIGRQGLNPLSPKNVLIFGTGTLTCTTAPSSGRTTVTCKSPYTNLYLKCSMGGHWGTELKFAGYDHLIIYGVSEKPVYLSINDNVVELKDASHLWGRDVREATGMIKKELGDEHTQVACIGPAGENLVKFASIMCSVYNAAGRGGAGAVMGSKKLKAIATRGNGEIIVRDPKGFGKAALAAREAFWNDPQGLKYWQWGTGGFLVSDKMSSCNYSKLNLEGGGSLTAPWMLRKGLFKRRQGCFGCSQSCHRYIELKTGPYAGIYTCGPEYETYASLGAECGIIDAEHVIKANDLANIMGMDTISSGHLISWAMESYERGVLTEDDTGGIELTFGNADAVIKLIPMIARREGIGDLLAEGIKHAAESIGKGSYKWASCNSKGLDQSGMDNRLRGAYALAFAVNPRGPDHLHSECMASFGWTPHQRELIEEVTGHGWAEMHDHLPEVVRWHEDVYAIADSLGFCAFTCTSALAVTPKNMAEMFSLATGIDITEKEIMLTGKRILTLEKCFNVREGATRKMDDLSWRAMNEPIPEGPLEGMVASQEWLDDNLDRYYKMHMWDLKTSWPYKETLNMLDLTDVADELEELGKIPGRN